MLSLSTRFAAGIPLSGGNDVDAPPSCIQEGNDCSSIKDCAAKLVAENVPPSVLGAGREEERNGTGRLAPVTFCLSSRCACIQLGSEPSSIVLGENVGGLLAGRGVRSPTRNDSNQAGSADCS